ncbi:MAG: DNA polymerase ligase N-terminal domain-containing protein [Bacillota bacterium]
MSEKLKSYNDKRNFKKTHEPKGKKTSSNNNPIFVIQKHDASNLHYDFRLEDDGVLKSWAIPKGPSTNPKETRLAIETEDHPLDYHDFEGHIPESEYGGGNVIVWDHGTYEHVTEKDDKAISFEKAYEKGHINVILHGEKLTGGFTLIHTNDDKWLLKKIKDDAADARRKPTKTEPTSVISGKTIEDIDNEKS